MAGEGKSTAFQARMRAYAVEGKSTACQAWTAGCPGTPWGGADAAGDCLLCGPVWARSDGDT